MLVYVPILMQAIDTFELTSEGKFKLADVVEDCRESIVVLNSQFVILHGNDITHEMLGESFEGCSIFEFIWSSEDLVSMRDTLQRLSQQYDAVPVTIEFRSYSSSVDQYKWLETSITNELKTPLQSFGFSLDLLGRTQLTEEQQLLKQLVLVEWPHILY
jgi:PAS domain-containing protein